MANPKQMAGLKIASQTEVNQDWSIVMRDLSLLAQWIQRAFAVDLSNVLNQENTIVQTDEPQGEDRGKLWIKTSNPPAIGVPFSNEYYLIYQYPASVPFIWTKGEPALPDFLRKLTGTELSDMSLTEPSNDFYFYVILEV